jgi:NADH-quinone oxidoreductase subunit J
MGYGLFFVLAGLILAAALGVVLNSHPVRSALCLAVTLFLLAVVFVFLDAHLVAALQIIVYAGAILVLFLFVIMLLNLQVDPPQRRQRSLILAALLAGGVFAVSILRSLLAGNAALPGAGFDMPVSESFGTSEALGEMLFTQFLLPTEITSVLLLVAVLGAVVLAKRHLR